MTPVTVPAPGQDNPQERLQQLVDCLPRKVLREEASRLVAALSAALEAATRERDEALAAQSRVEAMAAKWEGKKFAAERALAEMTRERDDAWHDRDIQKSVAHGYKVGVRLTMQEREAAERALEAARDALREIVEWRGCEDGIIEMKDIAQAALDASASTEGEA